MQESLRVEVRVLARVAKALGLEEAEAFLGGVLGAADPAPPSVVDVERAHEVDPQAAPPAVEDCGQVDPRDPRRSCRKPARPRHRHKYEATPNKPPKSRWTQVDTALVEVEHGVVEIRPGDKVAVRGFGRHTAKNPGGSAQEGWYVVSIKISDSDPEDINVEVSNPTVASSLPNRTVKIEKIVPRNRRRTR